MEKPGNSSLKIVVPGITTPRPFLGLLKQKMHHQYGEENVRFFDSHAYIHWQRETMKNKVDRVLQQILSAADQEISVDAIGHSMGGIILMAATAKAESLGAAEHINSINTVATPHQMNYLGVRGARDSLEAPKTVETNTNTYGMMGDIVVPFWMTATDNSNHTNIWWADHFSFLWNPIVQNRVLRAIETEDTTLSSEPDLAPKYA